MENSIEFGDANEKVDAIRIGHTLLDNQHLTERGVLGVHKQTHPHLLRIGSQIMRRKHTALTNRVTIDEPVETKRDRILGAKQQDARRLTEHEGSRHARNRSKREWKRSLGHRV